MGMFPIAMNISTAVHSTNTNALPSSTVQHQLFIPLNENNNFDKANKLTYII